MKHPGEYNVPGHLHAGLIAYIIDHVRPGGFLQSVISNDLQGAVQRGGSVSFSYLRKIVDFMNMEAPSSCWGSVEKMESWIKGK